MLLPSRDPGSAIWDLGKEQPGGDAAPSPAPLDPFEITCLATAHGTLELGSNTCAGKQYGVNSSRQRQSDSSPLNVMHNAAAMAATLGRRASMPVPVPGPATSSCSPPWLGPFPTAAPATARQPLHRHQQHSLSCCPSLLELQTGTDSSLHPLYRFTPPTPTSCSASSDPHGGPVPRD